MPHYVNFVIIPVYKVTLINRSDMGKIWCFGFGLPLYDGPSIYVVERVYLLKIISESPVWHCISLGGPAHGIVE